MSDQKRFGMMMSFVLQIGAQLKEASYYSGNCITVEGVLPDGRNVHFFITGKEEKDDDRSES